MADEYSRSDGPPKELDIIGEYRRRAAEAYEQLPHAANNDHRNAMLQIAETWLLLADQHKQMTRYYIGPAAPSDERTKFK
jgi:hypothetical protein